MSLPAERSVAVIGAGTMGPGIALAFAVGGWSVDLIGRREASESPALRRIDTSLDRLVETGTLGAAAAAEARTRIDWHNGLQPVEPNWALVIESITEDIDTKRELFGRLEDLVADETILASNTSSLSIDELMADLRLPERALGFHWLNPPEFVELVEIVLGRRTSPEAAATTLGWAREIGKVPVEVTRDAPGFIINRLQYALLREAFALVESGIATFEDIDSAMTSGLGARWAVVGPFEGLDLGGLDVYTAVAPRLYPTLSCTEEASPIATELVAEGVYGCKTGRGTRGTYEEGEADALIKRRDEMLLAMSALRAKR